MDVIKRRLCCCCRSPRYDVIETVVVNLKGDSGSPKAVPANILIERPSYGTMVIQFQSRDVERRHHTLTRQQLDALCLTQNGSVQFLGDRNCGIDHDLSTGLITVHARATHQTIAKWMDHSTWSMLSFRMGNYYDIVQVGMMFQTPTMALVTKSEEEEIFEDSGK